MKYRQGQWGSECRCGHHKSAHRYKPLPDTRKGPDYCVVPECVCVRYTPRQPYERREPVTDDESRTAQ